MRPPCELVQRDYLPLLRSLLAKKLNEEGKSQNQIAESMGITQAAVSKYLNQTSEKHPLLRAVNELATRMASEIISGTSRSDILVREICSTCMGLRIGSEICVMHRENIASLAEVDCDICSELLGGSNSDLSSRAETLSDIRDALRLLSDSTVFGRLVPQVRANIVACNKNAKSVADVIGIPGRITLVEGRVRSFSGPKFGASTHTASLLLEMRKSWSQVNSCLCISGQSHIVESAKTLGVQIISLNRSESNPRDIANAAKLKKMKPSSRKLLGIHVPGGIGVEPILYIFGPRATGLAEEAEEIGRLLDS
ncbi:MAG: thiamine-phosphate synthase family protein [Candidatus Thorarchaeota archaeon]|nr:thiamine-phosphate synthase family protein [Candidatus Thorarchaeota archaeon]